MKLFSHHLRQPLVIVHIISLFVSVYISYHVSIGKREISQIILHSNGLSSLKFKIKDGQSQSILLLCIVSKCSVTFVSLLVSLWQVRVFLDIKLSYV